jgi:glycosyltransferase involved in cell wall biosynthesis
MNEVATPLVSVIIPTYNHAQYLGRALQSVLDQTYVNWEVIVIDNHSEDNTDEVMASFIDSRITYLKVHNRGVIAVSRNVGIWAAKGEWVAFLDSDDWWANDKLEICLGYVTHKVDFIYHNLVIITKSHSFLGRKYTKSRQVESPVLKDLLLKGNTIATTSVVVRKNLLEKIGGMDESKEMNTAEDYNTWLRLAKLTDGFVLVPKTLGFYLFHSDGASRRNIKELLHNVCKEFLPLLNRRERLTYQATVNYVVALNDFHSGRRSSENASKLRYSIVNGSSQIKIKSLLLYVILIFIS